MEEFKGRKYQYLSYKTMHTRNICMRSCGRNIVLPWLCPEPGWIFIGLVIPTPFGVPVEAILCTPWDPIL